MPIIFKVHEGDHSQSSPLAVAPTDGDLLVKTCCREEVVQVLLNRKFTTTSVYMVATRGARFSERLQSEIKTLGEAWPSHPPIEVIDACNIRAVARPGVSTARLHAALGILRADSDGGETWDWVNDHVSLALLEAAGVDDTMGDYYGSFDFICNMLPAGLVYKTCQEMDWDRFSARRDRLTEMYRYLSPWYTKDYVGMPPGVVEKLRKACAEYRGDDSPSWSDIRTRANRVRRDWHRNASGDSFYGPISILITLYLKSQQRSSS